MTTHCPKTLHERLVELQSTAELERKAAKARRRGYWTQEDLDFAFRRGQEFRDLTGWR